MVVFSLILFFLVLGFLHFFSMIGAGAATDVVSDPDPEVSLSDSITFTGTGLDFLTYFTVQAAVSAMSWAEYGDE